MRKKGFVFVLTNKYISNFVIVGYSYKSPEQLAYVISRATGIPVDFSVSLIKKTNSPIDEYRRIMSSIPYNVTKNKNNISMIECDSKRFIGKMKSSFGFVDVKESSSLLTFILLFLISVFFVYLWYYNFFGLR